MKQISIIIVTYNSLSLIKDCIDSIFKYNDLDDKSIEIIVVDNSPSEENKRMFEYLEKLYGEKIILIVNKGNLGYGHGNNVGIKNASGKILSIMNPDVRLKEPIFIETIRDFNNNSKLALVGYKQVGGLNLSYRLRTQFNFLFLASLIIKFANKFNYFNPRFFSLSGALLFIDREKFNQVGKFDENIFMYCEESDISNRLLENKFEIKYNKNHKYDHLVDDARSYSEFIFKNLFISRRYYLRKYHLNENKYFERMKIDFQLKILFSKLIFDGKRKEKFQKEYALLMDLLKQTN